MAKFFIVALTVMLVMQGYVSWHVWRVLPKVAKNVKMNDRQEEPPRKSFRR